jgi:hypothetical protein
VRLPGNLPVEPRKRSVEAWIARPFCDYEVAVGVAVEPTDEFVQHICEVSRHSPFDVAFEQERETEIRKPKRDQDRYRTSKKKAQSQ